MSRRTFLLYCFFVAFGAMPLIGRAVRRAYHQALLEDGLIDYEGWCRKVYRVRALPRGELFEPGWAIVNARKVTAMAKALGGARG